MQPTTLESRQMQIEGKTRKRKSTAGPRYGWTYANALKLVAECTENANGKAYHRAKHDLPWRYRWAQAQHRCPASWRPAEHTHSNQSTLLWYVPQNTNEIIWSIWYKEQLVLKDIDNYQAKTKTKQQETATHHGREILNNDIARSWEEQNELETKVGKRR